MFQSAQHKAFFDKFFEIVIATFVVGWLSVILVNPVQARPLFSAIAVDARTGKIIFAKNADSKRYPASLTKMMTLYVLFEDLKAKRISMSTPLRVSRYAASRPPSKLGFKPGKTIRVRDAIRALVTKSANDVATAIAENLGGTERKFANRMTRTARRIGMTRSTFRNASGLPNRHQLTTARDMATLGLRLQRDFPAYYKFFALKRFTYRGRRYGNHNRLLGRIKGVDGIKTGYTRASGFNLTSSARRGKKRIVAVVMGGRTGGSRNRYMSALIKRMFAKARLTRSTRIASMAGRPPGYRNKPQRAATKLAKLINAPLPRRKPTRLTTKLENIPHKNQDRILPEVVEQPSNVSTFKVASIIDGGGKNDILEFKNDESSAAVKISDKNDLNLPAPVDTTKVAKPKKQQTAKKPPHTDSWNIQIGAFPTRKSAKGRLASATAKAKTRLRGKVPFTIEVRKNGARFYRARFAGFNRKTAKRACRTLTKKGIGCFALAPSS